MALKLQFESKILDKTKLIRGFSTGFKASDIKRGRRQVEDPGGGRLWGLVKDAGSGMNE